jgi:uncharacterized membrane protein
MWWIAIMACTGAPDTDSGLDAVASDSVASDTACSDAPTVTWNSWGQGFMKEACQSCHASTTENRYGAPDEVVFDTLEQTWDQADRILIRSVGDSPSMPPQGGVNADDRQRLAWWLTCAEPGT